MGSQNSDEDLVELASQGRLDAFDALIERYQDRVFNLLVRMCGSEPDAEDLTQKTFVSAWHALGTFRKGSRFYTWLYRIGLNAAFTHQRDKSRKRQARVRKSGRGAARRIGGSCDVRGESARSAQRRSAGGAP